MGFFNKILKGLGFEDEDVEEPKTKKIKEKKVKNNTKVTASYNLNELEEEKQPETKEKIEEIQTEKKQEQSEFEIVKASSQEDIQEVVKKIKSGLKVLLNIENLTSADLTRSLDFLTGAVFALDLKIQKLDERIYLIQ